MPSPSRILLIRPSALGDVCRTVPALASLRAAYPEARIDWLVQDTFAPAIRHHPGLSGVVEFPRKALGAALRRLDLRPLRGFLKSLVDAQYDVVYDLQGLFRSGFFAWSTKAPRRVGLANAREGGWLFLTERHRVPPEVHSVDRMLEVIGRSGVGLVHDMRLYPSPEARRRASVDLVLATSRYALLAPTSRWAGKRWPLERYAKVAGELLTRGYDHVVVVGAPNEREQCGPLLELAESNPRIVDRIGMTGIDDLLALVERSSLVIANDSAVLHMAVGLDRPLIALYGPTSIARVGPYRRAADVLQMVDPGEPLDHKNDDLGRRLMSRIQVSDVLERIDRGGR
ncbi:MAG: glycosyltransferase family 9 protein [Phycisphaerales bacterium]|nr:glycosyltransferase family 9 protein [Phycisphaerales bacterium]